MSRGFWSLVGGLAITVASQFLAWPWLIWPARILLRAYPPGRADNDQAIYLIALIVVNTAGWAAIIAGATFIARRFSRKAASSPSAD